MAEQEGQTQQEGQDKIEKSFNANIRKLIGLMKGEKNIKKGKVSKDEVAGVVDELIKERKEAALKKFKEDAIALLDQKVEFDKEVRKLEDELKNKVNAKKKEFTEKMQNLFKQVDSIEAIEKSYYSSLGGDSANATGTTADTDQA